MLRALSSSSSFIVFLTDPVHRCAIILFAVLGTLTHQLAIRTKLIYYGLRSQIFTLHDTVLSVLQVFPIFTSIIRGPLRMLNQDFFTASYSLTYLLENARSFEIMRILRPVVLAYWKPQHFSSVHKTYLRAPRANGASMRT